MLGYHAPVYNAELATKARAVVRPKTYKREPKQAQINRCLTCTESADYCSRCGKYKKEDKK